MLLGYALGHAWSDAQGVGVCSAEANAMRAQSLRAWSYARSYAQSYAQRRNVTREVMRNGDGACSASGNVTRVHFLRALTYALGYARGYAQRRSVMREAPLTPPPDPSICPPIAAYLGHNYMSLAGAPIHIHLLVRRD